MINEKQQLSRSTSSTSIRFRNGWDIRLKWKGVKSSSLSSVSTSSLSCKEQEDDNSLSLDRRSYRRRIGTKLASSVQLISRGLRRRGTDEETSRDAQTTFRGRQYVLMEEEMASDKSIRSSSKNKKKVSFDSTPCYNVYSYDPTNVNVDEEEGYDVNQLDLWYTREDFLENKEECFAKAEKDPEVKNYKRALLCYLYQENEDVLMHEQQRIGSLVASINKGHRGLEKCCQSQSRHRNAKKNVRAVVQYTNTLSFAAKMVSSQSSKLNVDALLCELSKKMSLSDRVSAQLMGQLDAYAACR